MNGPNPFRQANKSGGKMSKMAQNWGKVKFNPVAASARARVEEATPWKKYKHDIIQKDREEKQQASAVDVDSAQAKQFLKERQQNYTKMLMAAKRTEATKWEDFNDASAVPVAQSTTSKVTPQQNKTKNGTGQKFDAAGKSYKGTLHSDKFKRHNTCTPYERKLIDKIESNKGNFDSKTLTSEDNNYFRKMITKCTQLSKNTNLSSVISDMKKQRQLQLGGKRSMKPLSTSTEIKK